MAEFLPVSLSFFPGGRSKAVTLSYDDGVIHDRRLVEILNRYGLRGTFHLNSGTLGGEGKLVPGEIAALFEGHEVSAHSVSHPFLEQLPLAGVIHELSEDRRRLEALCGYPVRGMSYPYGTYNRQIMSLLPTIGLRYARTVNATRNFDVPEDFLAWNPTIHHNDDLLPATQRFLEERNAHLRLRLLYVWGHSYEFPRDNNWELMEQFGEKIGRREDVWYATNIEIADYVEALRRLEFSSDLGMVINPAAAPVWIKAGKNPVQLAPGSVTDLRTGETRPRPLWKI